MGEGPRLEPMEEAGRRLADLIEQRIPLETAFALHLHTRGPEGWSTFISNMNREDHAKVLLEMIVKSHPQTVKDLLESFWVWTTGNDGAAIEEAPAIVEHFMEEYTESE